MISVESIRWCSAAREPGPMAPMESQGWRKKSTVTVLYSYSYPVSNSSTNNSGSNDGGNEVSMREGERLILLEKSNMDWWQVRRPGDKSQPFYAPANYLQEDGISKAKKAIPSSPSSTTGSFLGSKSGHMAVNLSGHNKSNANRRHIGVSSSTSIAHLNETSRSDDCLHSPITARQPDMKSASGGGSKWSNRQVANSELRKQRSTSMDAIMFLELLENEIKDMPGGGGASGDDVNKRSGKGSSHNNKYGVDDSTHNRSSSSIGRQLKSESLVDRFKKPRISKDLWERRKSWAVEESTPPPPVHLMGRRHPVKEEETANINSVKHHRRSMQSLLAAPPLPPRLSVQQENQSSLGRVLRDKTTVTVSRRECNVDETDSGSSDKNSHADKAPALPPKKNPNQGVDASASPPVRLPKVDNYSRVIPLRSSAPSPGSSHINNNNSSSSAVSKGIPSSVTTANNNSSPQSPSTFLVSHNRALSESLEKLAQQIQTPLSYPHPIPPPRRSSSESMERSAGAMGQSASSSSPPRLPPKNAKLPAAKPPTPTATPKQQQPQISTQKLNNSESNSKKEVKDNYVNLMRPLTMVDTLDDIQSDESGINMSFNNPLFNEKEDGQDKGSQEQLGSSVDLESSIDDAISLKAVKTLRGSESNLSGSELEANYTSSCEDILSSKDSLNSIPSVKSDHSRSQMNKNNNNNTGSLTKPPPDSPGPRQRPRRELFENWFEYVDQTSGRPFYFNSENRAKSWKPPRRIGTSPITRGISIEEEKFNDGDQLSSSVDSHNSSTTNHQSRLVSEAIKEAHAKNHTLLSVPRGWIESVDPSTDEVFYTNSHTGAKWYTSLDNEGRVYFYEEDSTESLWSLPQVTSVPALTLTESEPGIQQGVYYPEGSKLSPKMNEQMTVAPVSTSKWDMVRQRTSKADRNSKTRSMVLTNFSGCVEDIAVENVSAEASRVTLLAPAKTASLPRNIQPQWPNLQGGSIVSDYLKNLDIRVLQQGFLHKTKLTENGKKIRKNWTSSWVVLTDLFLFLFKESSAKMSTTAAGSSTGTNKPELCVDLNGATIEWAAIKSSRKGVFQVSTLLGVQLLLQDEDETNAVVWFNEIKRAIQRLPCGTKVETTHHYPSPHSSPSIGSKPKKLSLEKSFSPVESRHKRNDSLTQYLSPPSPDSPVSFSNSSSLMKQGSRKNKLGRTKSTKVPFLGSTEDLTAVAPGSSRERQDNLRDKLRKFFVRRPTVDSLVKKGIWKDEPVFGCHLSALCHFDGSTVPKFVQQVIQLIESKQENMKADGIYRASGNLSQIQKIRCQVDQYNWAILEIEDDVHVLTGCLKLFFRELKEPLIPCPLFEKALQATNYQGPNPERIRRYRDIVESLPTENYDTLQYLLQHLLKITEYREHNRMHISNLAIVFGPTLMWAATVSNNLALDMMQQNLVVEALLNNYHNIFNR
ncbi:rho GTPase-activating protein 12-like isoform X3 [Daphnia pulicaria]|uniref:rho GTPase-activating protein 12-like isoform X3 n=1 Tax=Daphnia pulicaria TaxID=35523 RepID=UPI001EEB0DB8|nr:rho GTPase-activating protein 12-like isoform X3 [Daphnia pulicaria]